MLWLVRWVCAGGPWDAWSVAMAWAMLRAMVYLSSDFKSIPDSWMYVYREIFCG